MNSMMIGKIEKAKRYAEEPERIHFHDFQVTLAGNHRPHQVAYHQGDWKCDCEIFGQAGYCSHTMAMERVLGPMIQLDQVGAQPDGNGGNGA
jgi:hypothetical protein